MPRSSRSSRSSSTSSSSFSSSSSATVVLPSTEVRTHRARVPKHNGAFNFLVYAAGGRPGKVENIRCDKVTTTTGGHLRGGDRGRTYKEHTDTNFYLEAKRRRSRSGGDRYYDDLSDNDDAEFVGHARGGGGGGGGMPYRPNRGTPMWTAGGGAGGGGAFRFQRHGRRYTDSASVYGGPPQTKPMSNSSSDFSSSGDDEYADDYQPQQQYQQQDYQQQQYQQQAPHANTAPGPVHNPQPYTTSGMTGAMPGAMPGMMPGMMPGRARPMSGTAMPMPAGSGGGGRAAYTGRPPSRPAANGPPRGGAARRAPNIVDVD